MIRFRSLVVACPLGLLSACGSPEPAPAAIESPTQTLAAGAPPVLASREAPRTVEQTLADANQAFRDERLYAPPGRNALEFFLAARELDDSNLAVTEALVELFPLALAAAEAALAAGNTGEATRILDLLDRAQPGSLAVSMLRQRVAAQRTLTELKAAQAAATARAGAEAAPAPPVTREPLAGSEPSSNLPASARAAIAPAVAPAPSSPASTAQASAPAPPRAAASEAAPAAALDATAVRTTASVTTEPRVLQRVNPDYPALARTRRIEGYVELEFLVGVDGRAQEIRVIAAEPPGVFDAAAMRALMRWRFQPGTRDGRPEPMLSRTRIGFRQG